jgi:hypothetical protein
MNAIRTWGLSLCFLLGQGTSALLAQPENEKLKVQVSYDLTRTPIELQRLVLRPNTLQQVYFYITNPGEELRRNVTFKLVRLAQDGQPLVLQQATLPVIGPQKTVRVVFGKGAPAAKTDAPPEKKEPEKKEPDKAPPAMPKLEGPPFRMQVWIEQEKSPEPLKINVPVILMEPREYVGVGTGMLYDSKLNRLSIRVRSAKDFSGPPCPVQLALTPDLLPGLIPSKKGGVFKQFLTGPDQEVELAAMDLRFQDGPPRNGRIYLTVDGYERAFAFKSTFAQGILPPLGEEKRIRIYAPHYSQPGPKFPVRLEVDGSPSLPARIELGLDRVGNGQAYDTRTLKGLRFQEVQVGPNPEGDLLFKTDVRDWQTEIDAAEVYGKRLLRVQMLDGYQDQGKPLVLPIADEQTQGEETILLFQRLPQHLLAPLSFANNAVFAEIVLDDTPAEEIAFVKLPRTLPQGQAQNLALKARIKPRTEDQAPLQKVQFFLGKIPPDYKLPEEVVTAKFTDVRGEFWEGDLLLPSDLKDRVEVSVLTTTLTGVKMGVTEKILLIPPAPPGTAANAKKIAKITGTVREGDRPQAGLMVLLRDPKGMEKAKTKTDKKGEYVFDKVAPGSYFVYAERSVSQTKGQTPVTVAEDSETISKIDIKLFR